MTDRGEDTRERTLDAAMRLFAERGYDATSISGILEAAETTKGGFYFHFPSKLALAVAIVRQAGASPTRLGRRAVNSCGGAG